MGSLGCEDFYLIDQWPGNIDPFAHGPSMDFDATASGNRAAADGSYYKCGTKISLYQDSTVGAGGTNVANKGWYTLLYARYYSYEIASGTDVSFGTNGIVVPACSSAKARGEVAFTRDCSGGNEMTLSGPLGILCYSATNGCYNWLWVGGICPNHDLTRFDDLTGFLTDGNVVAGSFLTSTNQGADSSLALISCPANADGTNTILPVGFAWVDDT